MTEDPTPAEALAAIQRSQQDIQRKVAAGSWRYDIGYSAICAMMVGTQALDLPLNTLGVAVGVLLLTVLFRREANRLGVSITGMSPRRARWVAIGLGMVLIPLMVLAILLNHFATSGVMLALGAAALMAVAFVFCLIGSRLWLRVYRRETGVDQ
ncbi:hypothetical protein [Brevundimonas sp. Root1423]|uniref:hypothetical protein n=1 Tax=Brevundimonas sp. Root1423 TaxID=1736462 RepID=UPI0006F2D2E7|nr:hypothetical protein [Brevundimonas sp. Root1423]KQY91283.1 hypothetical protein ASD25_19160 [Brevundimonas sp. Root1423]